jgi:hypothetical protein
MIGSFQGGALAYGGWRHGGRTAEQPCIRSVWQTETMMLHAHRLRGLQGDGVHSNFRLVAHRTVRCTIHLGVPTARQRQSVVLCEPRAEVPGGDPFHADFNTNPSGISPSVA